MVRQTGILLFTIAALASTATLADGPPRDVFALQRWQSYNGAGMVGIVRTVGPMTAERCQRGISKLPRRYSDLPPDMQLAQQVCAPQPELQNFIGAFGCTATTHSPVKDMPEAQIWLYSCFMAM